MGKRNPNTDKAAAKDKGPDISDFIVAEEELKTLKKQQGIPDSSENLNALGRAIDYILTARERRIKQPIKKKPIFGCAFWAPSASTAFMPNSGSLQQSTC